MATVTSLVVPQGIIMRPGGSVSNPSLHAAEQALLTWLSKHLDEPEPDVLMRLLSSPHTSLDGGRLTQLSLRGVADALPSQVSGELAGLLSGLTQLDYLDVSGLDLRDLDLSSSERLRVLDCSDNALQHLDLTGCPRLVRVWCAGNRLMVLDVSGLAGLVELNCAGNEISGLSLPEHSRLEVLRCERNQLIVLDLGHQPRLRELACFRNGMHEIRISAAPALELLDCARNELRELSLTGLPRLRQLNCSRNALGELSLRGLGALEDLGCWRNYVQVLDVSETPSLRRLDCHGNQLRTLDLSTLGALEKVNCSDNRLRTLAVGTGPIASLDAGGNELEALDVSGCQLLCVLRVAGNELQALDLSTCTGLAELSCGGNALKTLDIRNNPELCELELLGSSAAPEVFATDALRHRLMALRDREGEGQQNTDVAQMTSWALHDYALSLIGRGSESELRRVIESGACDLGTALLVYWTSAPHYYTQYTRREEVEPYERDGWDLLRSIEARVGSGAYTKCRIWFNPTNDKQVRARTGHDWTQDRRRVRHPVRTPIPDVMWRVPHAQ